jgi:hypothetical protein
MWLRCGAKPLQQLGSLHQKTDARFPALESQREAT